MKISVIIPMYNEEENVEKTLNEIDNVLKSFDDYEIIIVDDGSSDNTFKLVNNFISDKSNFLLFRHKINMGMGKAIRTGFENSSGDILVTIDADLSYEPRDITKLVKKIDESNDIVIGSQYMSGGKTENIPFIRLFISKMANKIVGYSLGDNISTVTGVFRAYKREVIDSLELESNGTEINPEIISKASAVGFKIVEIPVKLKGRELGESKIRFRTTTISHLLFTFYEKPMVLFGLVGLFIIFIGIFSALYLFYQYLVGSLDPNRPLMLFMVLMILSGIQILTFGFIATQISTLKKDVYIIQKEIKIMKKELK